MGLYPSRADLNFIENYDVSKMGTRALARFVASIWHWDDYVIIGKRTRFELHTGGWSGNEDIIHSLQKNLWWGVCFRKEVIGGHYYFRLIKIKGVD